MIWDALLQLRETLKATPASHSVCIRLADPEGSRRTHIAVDAPDRHADIQISLNADAIAGPEKALSIAAPKAFSVRIEQALGNTRLLSCEQLRELETYLPYALLPCFAATHQRTFAISHFAQTLDGRIATHSGDSRWIGNPENLNHAHRMRALCDAILIGANTLRLDKPQLTVRHVSGQNPLRVIIGNSNDCEQDTGRDKTLHIRSRITPPAMTPANGTDNDSQLLIPAVDGDLDCAGILQALYQRGIQSVYIEGGATTTSAFLRHQALDQVQIHIAPRILGSGLNGFDLSVVDSMDDALQFRNPRFLPIGNEVMFIGEP